MGVLAKRRFIEVALLWVKGAGVPVCAGTPYIGSKTLETSPHDGRLIAFHHGAVS